MTIPPYLSDYMFFAADNEAPEMFHIWGAYVTLSAAVGRKVWIPEGPNAIYANIYVMYVGDAGNGKSVALYAVKRLLNELDLPISRSVETPEGLWHFMGGDPTAVPKPKPPGIGVQQIVRWPDNIERPSHRMTVVANEFINFIAPNPTGWMGSLNDIFDEDNYSYRTKNMGQFNLLGPYIVFLGNLTTDVSNELQKAKIIASGFARRTLFQYGKRKFHDPHPFREFTEQQREAQKRCVAHLRSVMSAQGEFFISQDTKAWFSDWYIKHTKDIPRKATPQTVGWFTSKPNQVWKVAMLTSLAESTELVVNVEHLQLAMTYIEQMERDLYQVFGGSGRNELASVALKIFEYVNSLQDPIRLNMLKARFFQSCRPPNDFDECMNYLISDSLLIKWNPSFVTGELVATAPVKSHFDSHGDLTRIAQPNRADRPSLHPGSLPQIDPSSAPLPPPPDLPEVGPI